MPTHADRLLRCVRRIASQAGPESDDSGLLTRFLTDRDSAAFEALVARHGPMVLRVCQRVLGNRHDAEDAFQATFLVLARKAASVCPPGALAAWLHGVACRVALGARAAARRWLGEGLAPDLAPPDPRPDPLTELTAREALRILEEEVQHLPESYRLPVVLCCLHGVSQEEAARQLGWTPGSVKGRLERGRQRLHRRLVTRGLGLGAALALVELSRGTATGLTGTLAEATAKAALAFTARGPAGADFASGKVVALAHAGLRHVGLARAKLGVLLLAVAAVTAGLAVSVPRGPAGESPEKPRRAVESGQAAQDAQLSKSSSDKAQARTDRYGDPLPEGAVSRLGTVRFRLSGWGESVLFTPDGQRLISGDGGGGPRLWEVSTGRPLGQFSLPGNQRLGPIALSPGGRTLAAGGRDGAIHLFDLRTGKTVQRLVGPPEEASALAFSPDGKLLASGRDFDLPRKQGQDNPIQLWDVATGKELRRLIGHKDRVLSIAFSPDGKTLASGAQRYDATLRLWDVVTGNEVFALKGHGGELQSVAFSPDGKTVATGSMDKTIHLWDPATGKEKRRLSGHQGDVMAVTFSPDGRVLASGGFDRTLRLWDPARGKQLRQVELDEAGNARTFTSSSKYRINRGFAAVAFSPDGKTLAAAGRDHTLRLFDAATGNEVRPIQGQFDAVDAVAFTPDGGRVWTVGGDRNLRAWEPTAAKEVRALATSAGLPLCVAFSADGRLAATGCEDKAARVWDLATGREVQRLATPDVIGALAFAPDGRTLATANRWQRAEVRLWDVSTGKLLHQLPAPSEQGSTVGSLLFAPDGRTLVGVTSDGIIAFWRPATGAESRPQLKHFGHCQGAALAPDGRTLAVGNMNGTICLYEMATRKERLRCRGWPFRFSPDGRLLAAGAGNTVAVWDLASGEEVGRFPGHRGDVAALAFSADGTRLVSGSQDTTALVWDLSALPRPARPTLTRGRLGQLWQELAGADAAAAYRAVGALAAAEQAVPFLADKLRTKPPADPKQVARLVADLDSEQFAVRERASTDLERLGEVAEPALRQALRGNVSAEVRRRLGEVLDRLQVWSPERLRADRALEALERVGTPEAREVVAKLARDSSGTWTGTAARDTLRRLERRKR
jgi:RNA polymerase sigma factor (sigma-70 family)